MDCPCMVLSVRVYDVPSVWLAQTRKDIPRTMPPNPVQAMVGEPNRPIPRRDSTGAIITETKHDRKAIPIVRVVPRSDMVASNDLAAAPRLSAPSTKKIVASRP